RPGRVDHPSASSRRAGRGERGHLRRRHPPGPAHHHPRAPVGRGRDARRPRRRRRRRRCGRRLGLFRPRRPAPAHLARRPAAQPVGVRVDQSMFRQASFVTHALGNLRRALLAGVVLVLVVLVLFTGSKRAAFVSVVAIPLSLLAAVTVLRAAGATLNVMVLGGLAIAVGEVVDDAIIDVENAWRRLRAAPASARADDVVLAASVEVRSAVVYATVMVALVFLPVFLLGGLEGALF